jgi:uncharacterized protein involved in type VI secretion and phage assembly
MRYAGVYYGIVTQNQDPEGLNRVKVRFPWLDGGDRDEAHWAQLATPMGGKSFGFYALPDVDDAVAMMFIGGDINHPVILGGVWSKEDPPPEPNQDGKNNFRGYRSRAGHRLIFDDTSKTKVVLSDSSTSLMMGQGEFDQEGQGPNASAVLKAGGVGKQGVSFSSLQGNVEVSCPRGKLIVEAGKNITIDVGTATQIKAGGELAMYGNLSKVTSAAPAAYAGATTFIGPGSGGGTASVRTLRKP